MNDGKSNKLSSNAFATLIIDALVDGQIISKEDEKKSLEIVTNEIDARKAIGDY